MRLSLFPVFKVSTKHALSRSRSNRNTKPKPAGTKTYISQLLVCKRHDSFKDDNISTIQIML